MNYIKKLREKIGHDAIFMPASACCIINNNQILLQKRVDNKKWAIHGGALEFGETFEEALYREVKEELNIYPIEPQFFNIYSGENLHFFYSNKDEVYVVVAIYIVKRYDGDVKVDKNEVLEVKWFDFDNLPNDINIPDKKPINDIINCLKNK